jgi:precorrin-6B methylase 2
MISNHRVKIKRKKENCNRYKVKNLKILKGSAGTFTSLTPLSMQDLKLNGTATLIDQSMSPYHAGEPRHYAAFG